MSLTHTNGVEKKMKDFFIFRVYCSSYENIAEKKASNDERHKKKENLLNEEREKSYEKHIFFPYTFQSSKK